MKNIKKYKKWEKNKDFKKKTEEEVAAIRGVGKVSMKILKENGVVYKKKRKKK